MIKIPILLYHSISQKGTKQFLKFTLSAEMFAQHMEHISNQGYAPLTVAEYAHLVNTSVPGLPEKPIIITFDDGFADFYENALPILEKFRFSASLYVVTNDIGGTSKWLKPEGEENRKMLTWSQLSEIQKAGIECGAHTHTHIHLDTAKPEVARQEIIHSKDILEQKLGTPVYSLAYPYGHYNNNIRQLAIESKYSAACAVRNAMSHIGDDLFGLARISINHKTDIGSLNNLLTGKKLQLAPQNEYPRVTIWRQVRRIQQLVSKKSR